MIIRPESPADHDAVHDCLLDAFETDAEANLVRAIRDDAAFDPALSLVALDEHLIGHILFTPAPIVSDLATHPALALAPMAVRTTHQRRGVGAALIRAGLDACREQGHAIVHVLGDPAYYTRFGFRREPAITCPFDPGGDHFMALELTGAALTAVRGEVRYLPAFLSM